MGDQAPLSADEVLDVVDERDRVVGQARRAEVYARRLRHRCAFVLARDADGRVFVHRRTARKLVFPSLYDMFVGGVLATGESYDEAARREAEEELGVTGLPAPTPLFRFLYEVWWRVDADCRGRPPGRPLTPAEPPGRRSTEVQLSPLCSTPLDLSNVMPPQSSRRSTRPCYTAGRPGRPLASADAPS